ncbi:MAG: polysaccharide deacetylase family protein, partial [Ruminococcus sp.]|nr:polysaccharide deacetylase family protein [Candidatus Apopatosoma intestinale]
MRKAICGFFGILCLILLSVTLSAGEAEVVFSGADEGGKRIALTFDDGPHATRTAEVLDMLSEYHVRATFFVVGTNVSRFPDLVRRERSEGHEIGNHTYDHARLSCCSEAEISDEIAGAEDLLMETVGHIPTLFRPPEGA